MVDYDGFDVLQVGGQEWSGRARRPLVGPVVWLVSRGAIDRGLAEGSPERVEEMLEQADA